MVLFAQSMLYMIRVNTPRTVCTAYSVNRTSSDCGSEVVPILISTTVYTRFQHNM